MAIIKTYPLKNNYYGPDRLILSDMQPDDQGVVHGTTKSLTLSNLKSFIGGGGATLQLTTNFTSGAATFDVNTNILNIPDYSVGNVDGSGTAGRIPKWQDANTLDDSEIFQSGTGYVGIGTTSPNSKLNIVDSNSSYSVSGDNSGNVYNISSNGELRFKANGSETQAFVINNNLISTNKTAYFASNVGIGTTSPGAKLQVAGTSGTTQAIIGHGIQNLYVGVSGTNVDFKSSGNTTGTFSFSTGNNERIRITSGGNVGIGTTIPGAKLDINNDVQIDTYQAGTSTNHDAGYVKLLSDAKAYWLPGDELGKIEFYSKDPSGIGARNAASIRAVNSYSSQTFEGELAFYTSFYNSAEAEAVRIDGAGTLLLLGDGSTNAGKLRLNCSANTHSVEIVGPDHSGGTSYSLKLPNSLPGVSNQILESNALGVLSWIPTPSGGGGGGGTVTSVGLSAPPAFSVGNSPITGSGNISLGVTGGTAGEFLAHNGQWATPTDTNSTYVLGTGSTAGQIVLTGSNPTTSQTVTIGGTNGISMTQFTSGTFNVNLGLATSSTRGGVKVGFVESGKNYPVELSSEKMFVNVPWTDTVYTLPEATTTVRGGIELFSNNTQTTAANSVTTTANRTYGIQLNAANQAVVNVPWVGGGTGSPAGVANNVQFSNGTSFSADVNFNWDSSLNKLILGKDSAPQYQEGILRLLGDGTSGGTAGTIEFQSAYGKSGGAAATVKLQGPSSGVTQEILLPDSLPTSNTQVLGIDTIVGTKVTTQWETPTSVKLGFSPSSIYQATHAITSEDTGRSIWRASVVETDCTIDKVDFFVTAETGAVDLTVAVYVGFMTSANRVLIGTSSALVTGINTITFATSYTFSAGDNIIIYTSQEGGEGNSTIAGQSVLSNAFMIRQELAYSSTPASSISAPLTTGDRVLALHFYDE